MFHELRRPSFKLGIPSTVVHKKAGPLPKAPKGHGSYGNNRSNFRAPPIKPRTIPNFDRIRELDIEQNGSIVQLSQKSLGKLFNIQVPDPTDTVWLAEKARLSVDFEERIKARISGISDKKLKEEVDIMLQSNKPLGRPQRMIEKTQNIGSSKLSVDQKLHEIREEFKEGRGDSMQQQATLLAEIAKLMNSPAKIEALSPPQLLKINEIISKLSEIPKNVEDARLPSMVDSSDIVGIPGISFMPSLSGLIIAFILKNTPYSLDKPLKKWSNTEQKYVDADILEVTRLHQIKGKRAPRWIDLRSFHIETPESLVINNIQLTDEEMGKIDESMTLTTRPVRCCRQTILTPVLQVVPRIL